MFRPITGSRPVSLTAAAVAAGTTASAINHLFNRGLTLLSEPARSCKSAREFYPVDIFRVAALTRLVDFGFNRAEAMEILRASIDHRLGSVGRFAPDAWPVLRGYLTDAELVISREAGGLAITFAPIGLRAEHGAIAVRIDCVTLLNTVQNRLAAFQSFERTV